MSSNSRGYRFDCHLCGARFHFDGFEVEEDGSMTMFGRCSQLCEGQEDFVGIPIPKEVLDKLANRRQSQREFAELMEDAGFPDPEEKEDGL